MKTTIFCGFDWATETHCFVVKNARKEVLAHGPVPNSAEGFDRLLESFETHRKGGRVALIVEANRGLPLNALMEVPWLEVFPVNPMKTRRLNELEGSVRQKSDAGDCSLLCDYLIDNRAKLSERYVERDSTFRQMREWIGMEADLINHCRQIKQRIISHLNTFMPDLGKLLPDLDKKVYVRYLMDFDPLSLAPATEVEDFLRRHRVRDGRTIKDFVQAHESLRALGSDGGFLAAQRDILQRWATMLWQMRQSLKDCQSQIQALFRTLPQADIYRSFPGLGELLAPRMACLFGSRPSERFRCKEQAIAYFGQSPVTEQSGKGVRVNKRRNCHRAARDTCFLWAMSVNKMPKCHWQRSFLKKHKERGDARPTRYRKLGQKLVGILYRCVVHNELYDEAKYCRNLHQRT